MNRLLDGRVGTGVVEVAALELGWNQLEDMGVGLAGQVAEYLARIGDGLIRVAVGGEDPEDLEEDFIQALDKA